MCYDEALAVEMCYDEALAAGEARTISAACASHPRATSTPAARRIDRSREFRRAANHALINATSTLNAPEGGMQASFGPGGGQMS